MTTLEQLAADVFSEGREYYGLRNTNVCDGKSQYIGRFSDYEMAQLNDLASEIYDGRRCGYLPDADCDGPWRSSD